jgi:hypothetical protein
MRKKFPTVTFLDTPCEIQLGEYPNGRLAISLIISETGKPMARATVNLPNEYLPSDHVFIKEYSENEGMTQALLAANIIEYNAGVTIVGHNATVTLCKLNEELFNA